ncbi:MAG TPA: glycosyltransferase, partial [Burkholderiaceae bacterium]|nr:glycosyltransferase [Burkholderiaceae bacterium]
MKIALINTLYPPLSVGGAERVVQSLARGLVDGGDSVTVLTLASDRQTAVEQAEGVDIVRLPLQNLYWPFGAQASAPARLLWHAVDSHNLAAARALENQLRRLRPDLVHTHNLAGFSSLAWRAAKALGLPLVHTLHDYYLLCPRSTMRRGKINCASPCASCNVFGTARRAKAPLVDSVVGVSDFILRRHESLGVFPAHAARRVIHNGLTHATPPAAPMRPQRPCADVLRLGYLGRIEAAKGIEYLLRATSELAPGSWQLRIAGKGDAAYAAGLKAAYPSEAITY